MEMNAPGETVGPLGRAIQLLESDPEVCALVHDLVEARQRQQQQDPASAHGSQSEEAQALQMEIAKQAVALQELQSIAENQREELEELSRAHGELLVAVALQSHTILSVCSSHARGGLRLSGADREANQR